MARIEDVYTAAYVELCKADVDVLKRSADELEDLAAASKSIGEAACTAISGEPCGMLEPGVVIEIDEEEPRLRSVVLRQCGVEYICKAAKCAFGENFVKDSGAEGLPVKIAASDLTNKINLLHNS